MAAAPVDPTGMLIEALFRPSTRYRDSHAYLLPARITEVELLPGLPIENVLATGITWEDFLHFIRNKIVWITADAYVCISLVYLQSDSTVLELSSDDPYTRMFVRTVQGTADAVATATCDFLLRLLGTSEQHGVFIGGRGISHLSPLSGAGLSLFFQESRSCLRKVRLSFIALSEDLCCALVQVEIRYGSLSDDALDAFTECLHTDRGPITLFNCRIDSRVLVSALTGNSRVTRLELLPPNWTADDTNESDFYRALANNRGLVDLNLRYCAINDENWSILCESLQAHPTLTSLDHTIPRVPTGASIVLVRNQNAQRTRWQQI
jgi:hypothetical protein